ncbi:MAG: hypothetical protein LIP01_09340 [Tannerellaceae bacterium]|nr:hypothetical protein [Tannerellaceae bacterium]
MKSLETILSFLLSLAGVLFQPVRRKKPPCYPCPWIEDSTAGKGDVPEASVESGPECEGLKR